MVAALFEVAWAVCLKCSEGFTRFWPAAAAVAALLLSAGLLGLAAKTLPIGTAYAVWTGLGAVGTVLCGAALLGDPVTPVHLVCLGLILTGIVGLKLA